MSGNLGAAVFDLRVDDTQYDRAWTGAERRARSGADRIEREVGMLRGIFSSLGKMVEGAFMGVGFAAFNAGLHGITSAFKGTIGGAINFEARMSGIGSVAGATGAELDDLRKLSLQLGKDTSYSAGEAAAAIEEMIKGGIKIPDVMNGGAKAVLNLAAAGGVELTDAAEIASNAMAIFNINGEGMGHVADMIAGAANASSLSVTDFKYSLAAAGAVAAGNGQSFDDLSVAIAVMGQNGIKGSDAGTSLKTMLGNLQPSTDKQTQAMMDLGIVTADGTNKFVNANGTYKSMAEVAEILQESTEHLTDAQKMQTLETIFGSDAIRAATIFAKAGGEGFAAMAGDMSKVTAESVAMQRLDNVKGSIEQLKGSLETAAIIIGSAFLPGIRSVVDWATKTVNAMMPMLEAAGPRLADAIGRGGAALQRFGGIVAGIGTVVVRALQMEAGGSFTAFLGALDKIPEGAQPAALAIAQFAMNVRRFIVDTALPALQRFGDWFTDTALPALRAFGDLAARVFDTVRPHFATIATVVGVAAGTFGRLTFAVTAVSTIMGAISAAGGPIAALVGILGGPLTLAIGAVALGFGLFVVAWKRDFGGMRTALTDFWERSARPALAELAVFLRDRVLAAARALADFWTGTLQPALRGVLTWLGETALPAVGRAAETYFGAALMAVRTFGMFITEVFWPSARLVFDSLRTNVLPVLAEAFRAAWSLIGRSTSGALDLLQSFWRWLQDDALPWVQVVGLPLLRAGFATAFAAVEGAVGAAYRFMRGTVWPWLRDEALPWLSDVALPAARRAAELAWDGIATAVGATYRFLSGTVWPWLRNEALPWLTDDAFPALRRVAEIAWGGISAAVGATYRFLSGTVWPWLRDDAIPWLQDRALPALQRVFAQVWSDISAAVGRSYRFFRDEIWPWLQNTAIPWLKDEALPQLEQRFATVWRDIGRAVGEVVRVWRENIWPWLQNTAFPWLQNVALPALREAFKQDWREIMAAVDAFYRFGRDTVWPWLRDTAFPWLQNVALPALLREFDLTWRDITTVVGKTYDFLKNTVWPWLQRELKIFTEQDLPAFLNAFWDAFGRDDDSGIRGVVNDAMYNIQRLINDPKATIMDGLLWPFREAKAAIGRVLFDLGFQIRNRLQADLDTIYDFARKIAGAIDWIAEKLGISARIGDIGATPSLLGGYDTGQGAGGGGQTYAAGTAFHPGGPALFAEEGREFVRPTRRAPWALVERPTVANLARGAAVVPNNMTETILAGGIPGYAAGTFGSGSELRDYVLRAYPFTNDARDLLSDIPVNLIDASLQPQYPWAGLYSAGLAGDKIDIVGQSHEVMIHELTHAWAARAGWYTRRGGWADAVPGFGEVHSQDHPAFDAAVRALAETGAGEAAQLAMQTFTNPHSHKVDERLDNTTERFAFLAGWTLGDISRVGPEVAEFYEHLFHNPFGGVREPLPQSVWVGDGPDPTIRMTPEQRLAETIGKDRFAGWVEERFRMFLDPTHIDYGLGNPRKELDDFADGGLSSDFMEIFRRVAALYRFPPGIMPGTGSAVPGIGPPSNAPESMVAGPEVGTLPGVLDNALGGLSDILSRPAEWLRDRALGAIGVPELRLGGALGAIGEGVGQKIREWMRQRVDAMMASVRPVIPKGSGGGGGLWGYPLVGALTQGFGENIVDYPLTMGRGHSGIDIAAALGSVIAAVAAGTVTRAGDSGGGYGNLVAIDHGGGLASLYAHLDQIFVGGGDGVSRGQALGTVGMTGRTTGPHLHFEALENGVAVDPLRYLNATSGDLVGGTVNDWLLAAIHRVGAPEHWLDELGIIAHYESGGDPNALNLWDINAQNGNPSMGLMQVISDHFLPGEDPYNPIDNATAALRYIMRRYGSAELVPGVLSTRAGRAYEPYADGGIIDEPTIARTASGRNLLMGERGREAVIPLATLAMVGEDVRDVLRDLAASKDNGPRFGDIIINETGVNLDARRLAAELADIDWLFKGSR